MTKNLTQKIQPFISILIIIVSLFIAAFFKITLRRMSYAIYKETENLSKTQDAYYKTLTEHAGLARAEKLERLARRHSLHKTKKGQIIQVIDGKAIVVE